jgi:hypothetical protein
MAQKSVDIHGFALRMKYFRGILLDYQTQVENNRNKSIIQDTITYMKILRDVIKPLQDNLITFENALNSQIQVNEKIKRVPQRELKKLNQDLEEILYLNEITE